MAQGKINFTVGFQVDQSGLNQLKQSLASLQTMQAVEFKADSFDEAKAKLKNIKSVASEVQSALAKSFNAKLNTYNIDVFQKKLAESGMTLGTLQAQFAQAGVKGQIAFRNLATAITSTKLPLQESHNLLRSLGKTFANTIKWSIASTAINTVTSSIQQAWSYTQKLDESLNNIMLVTEKSADQMSNFAVQANKAAKALGASTTDYTNAALIYYQQGLSDAEVKARTETTLKTANVTKQSTEAVSEQLTAVWNGYKVSAAESELYIDKLASVAASTAADLEELSTGMSKVASAANNMGVDIDQLNGLLATAISVTRQAPETVGTAFKTIFARITDIEAGLDEETTLGEYTEKMSKLGVSVLDSNNKLRNMGDVIEEIGAKWKTMSREQQVALAQTMAGTRQYNNLLAVFENWNMYEQAVRTSADSVGFLQQQNEEYLTSIEAHLNQLKTSGERVYKALLDPKDANNLIDVLTEIVDLFANFVESIGGGKNLLMALIPLLTRAFSGTIASGLATFATNLGNASTKAEMLRNMLSTIDNIKSAGLDEYTSKIVELKNQLTVLAQQGVITNEEFNTLSDSLKEYSTWANNIDMAQDTINKTPGKYKQVLASTGMTSSLDESVWTDLEQHGKSTFEGSTDAASFFTDSDAGQKLTAELEIAKIKVEEIFTVTSQIEGSVKQISKIKITDKDLTEKQNETVESLKNKYEELKKILQQVADNNPADPASEKIKKQIANIEQLILKEDKTRTGVKQLANEINRLAVQGEQAGQKLNTQIDGVQSNLYEIANGTLPRLQSKAGELNQTFEAFLPRKTLEAKIQSFTNLTSQIAMAASAASMLFNLGDIFSNEDLTTGEKFLQLVQNLGFSLGMLSPMLLAIAKGYKALNTEVALNNAQTTVANTVQTLNNNGYRDKALLMQLLMRHSKDLTAEQYKEIFTLIQETKQLDENTAAQIKNNLAKKLAENDTNGLKNVKTGLKTRFSNFGKGFKEANKAGAWKGASGAATAGTQAAGGASAVGASAGSTVAAALPYVALIAVIVAAIAGGFALSKSIAEEEEKALEKATEAAKHQQEVLAQTTQEWENLKRSVDNLESAEANLENLTKETVEWKKAIADINAEVLALINKYPELSREVKKTADGMLKLSETGLEAIQEKQFKELQQAQAMSYMSNKMQRDAQYEVLKEDYVEAKRGDLASGVGEYGAGAGAATGAGVGLGIGAFFGPFGALVGGAIGAVVGLAAGAISQAVSDAEEDSQMAKIDTDKDIQAVFKLYASGMADNMFNSVEAFEKALKEHGIPINENTKALIENSKETKALAEAYKTKTASDHYEAIEIGKQVLGEGYSDLEYLEIGESTRKQAEDSYESIVNELSGGNKADRKAVEEYLTGLGIDPTTAQIGVKGSNKFQYTYDGKTYDLDIETAYRGIASQRAIENAKKQDVKSSNLSLLAVKAGSIEAANALTQLRLGTADFSNISAKAFKNLQKLVGEEELFADISEDAYKLFTNSVKEMDSAYASLWSNAEAQKHFNTFGINLDDLSFDEQKVFVEQYQDLYKYYGEETAATLGQVLQAAGTKAPELINAITTDIDWTTVTDPVETALNLLDDQGINVSNDLRSAFGNLGYLLAGTTTPLEKLQDRFSTMQSIIAEIGKDSQLARDKYNELSDEQKEYFELMADGTAILLEDAIAYEAQMRKKAQDEAREDVKNARSQLKQATEVAGTADLAVTTASADLSTAQNNLSLWEQNGKLRAESDITRLTENLNQILKIKINPLMDKGGILPEQRIFNAISSNVKNGLLDPNEELYLKYVEILKNKTFNKDQSNIDTTQLTDEDWLVLAGVFDPINYRELIEKKDYWNKYETDLPQAVSDAKTELENKEKEKTNALQNEQTKKKNLSDFLLQYARTFSYSELLNAFEEGTDKDLNELSEEERNDLLFAKQKELVAKEILPGLNPDALEDLLEVTGKDFDTLISELADKHLVLDEALESHQKTLDDLTDSYQKLVGAAKLDNIQKQIEELNKITEISEEQFKRFKNQQSIVGEVNFKNITENLSVVTDKSLGVDYRELFNKDGSLNYEAVKQIEDFYYDNLNDITTNDSLKLEFDDLFKFITDYDDKYDDHLEKLADQSKQKLEKEFEKFELEFQIKIDEQQFTKDTEKFWREFSNYGATAFATSLQTSLGATQEMFNIYFEKFNELSVQNLTLSEIITNKQEALNQLQENALTQKQEIAELEEFINSIYETRIEYQQSVIDLAEKQIALNKLIYGDDKYDMFAGLMAQNKAAYAEATKYAKQAAIAAQNEVNKFTGDKTSEAYKTLVQKAIDATQAWGDAIEAETQYVVSAYETSVDRIFNAIEEAATGANRAEWARETEWVSSTDERWLDDIEGIYALRDVEREYDKAIEKASGAQKKALQDRKAAELTILEAKKQEGKLQQADVERSQKVLEIEQARMALEDARNNKTKMRLTRGADGTYGYQYVADSDAMREAEDKLNGLYEDLYTFDKKRYKDALDEIAALWEEYATKRKELGVDGDLDEKDLAILKGYAEEINKISEVSGTTLYNLGEDIKTAYGEGLTAEEVATLIRTNVGAASTGIANFANDILQKGIEGVIGNYQLELDTETQAIDDYFAKVKDEMDPKKKGSFANHLSSVKELAEGVVTAFGELDVTDLNTKLGELKTVFDNLAASIKSCIDNLITLKVINDTKDANEAKALAEEYGVSNVGHTMVAWGKSNIEGLNSNSTTGEVMQGLYNEGVRWDTEESRRADFNAWMTWMDANGINFPTDKKDDESYWGEQITYTNLLQALSMMPSNNSLATNYLKNLVGEKVYNKLIAEKKIPQFDTGGYTGSWDSSGKLAVLHEKELVLNKEDTKNILESVSIVRSITSALEGLSNNRIVQMMSGFETSMAAWDVAKEMVIEQKVDITAEFPNATDKDEIMEAFDNLINLASQHAYKTTR